MRSIVAAALLVALGCVETAHVFRTDAQPTGGDYHGMKHPDLQPAGKFHDDYVHDSRPSPVTAEQHSVQSDAKYAKDYVKDTNGKKTEKKTEPAEKSGAVHATGVAAALVIGVVLPHL
eukprot:gnl/TRDRNA2_/TRDRNA2_181243_c0_seq1.p3 gnl/TRDRNA2_/TRDRNA2_181243_c0~~gnl/TRDRNA2_/TRDRNA2_181243_c0_seq1.p3  ORF type:complete len:118 (+),score=30.10 gnl/TRDRNA2_/TRDRNA2_181243_c0_seq1:62-415(+)